MWGESSTIILRFLISLSIALMIMLLLLSAFLILRIVRHRTTRHCHKRQTTTVRTRTWSPFLDVRIILNRVKKIQPSISLSPPSSSSPKRPNSVHVAVEKYKKLSFFNSLFSIFNGQDRILMTEYTPVASGIQYPNRCRCPCLNPIIVKTARTKTFYLFTLLVYTSPKLGKYFCAHFGLCCR
jgi:hypothetical protein